MLSQLNSLFEKICHGTHVLQQRMSKYSDTAIEVWSGIIKRSRSLAHCVMTGPTRIYFYTKQ